MEYTIEPMKREDWEEVRAIYEQGISTENATFEAEVPEWEKWESSHLKECRLVARVSRRVAGWAAISRVSSRLCYAGVAELSIYVGDEFRRTGIGSALLAALIEASEKNGFWTLQGGVFPENLASIELHKKHGFRVVGFREKIARMAYGAGRGTWRDVLLLERRSKIAGRD